MTMNNDEFIFDDVMETVGNSGKFQKRFNILFNFILVFVATMPYMNPIFAIVLPDHWCKVPGRDLTNMTVDEWKRFTIPRENNSMGVASFNKCKMYNISINEGTHFKAVDVIENNNQITDCLYGWEYDTTWYKITTPSEENWVCDKELNVANSFAMIKIGEVFGTLLFGQLGDSFGRKFVFFTAIIVTTFGRSLTVFTSANLTWFMVFIFIGSTSSTLVFMSPLIIAMEISRNKDRTYIAMLQCIAWTMALCFMPLLMWFIGDWKPFMLITTLPCALYLFSNSIIIESPRWLAAKKKVKRCLKVLKKIAKVNDKTVPDDLELKLIKIGLNTEKVYGVMSLFSSWRLAKNTALIVVGSVVNILIYLTLTLNVSNSGGNPFMNYFWQGLAELPSYIVAKYSCDYIGRRWTYTLGIITTFIACISLIFIAADPNYVILTSSLMVFLKFTCCFSFYAIQMQYLEIYPTCLRQTGQSLAVVMSNAAGILAPFIVYLGTSVDASYPYIICTGLSFIGFVSGFFLPETLNMKLPETLAEAKVFGLNQKYFSIRQDEPSTI